MTARSVPRREHRKLRHVRKTKLALLYHSRILKQRAFSWKRIRRVVQKGTFVQYGQAIQQGLTAYTAQQSYFRTPFYPKTVRVRNRFKQQHQAVQQFKYFYGNLKERQLQRMVWQSEVKYRRNLRRHEGASQTKKRQLLRASSPLRHFETRLSTALWRSFLVSSVLSARQLITHGQVYVNGRKAWSPSLTLKAGDLVTIQAGQWASHINSQKALRFRTPAPHLEVRVNTGRFIFCYLPFENELNFPIPMSLRHLNAYYSNV